MNIIDTHVHSAFSFDGEHSPREMIEKAIEMGLYALTFTDHIDVSNYYGSHYRQSELMPLGAAEIPPLKDEYKDRINIGFGAELGQFVHEPALSRKLIADFGFDFVIGATHEVRGHEDFYYLDYHEQNIPELLRLYFNETLEMVQTADIDVIGHLTYFLRYITGRDGIVVDLNEYTENIRNIFKIAAGRGIGLEINTGGLRKQGYGKADPGLEYVRMFKEAGGEIITIGSDAHRIQDIAANFKEGAEIAKAAGFKRTAYYEKRKPVFVELE
ncbi:MAG: histidinol-phosphatase HisJ family protein [Oscillospiraceae bacterium]|jgi:histidinol-phosphatase (PHP family)|nr:histidinol-phosphatase HisJ family protein [Oscillospiraceae bacterium]